MAVSDVEAAAYLSVIRRISEALAAREPGTEGRESRWGEREEVELFRAPKLAFGPENLPLLGRKFHFHFQLPLF